MRVRPTDSCIIDVECEMVHTRTFRRNVALYAGLCNEPSVRIVKGAMAGVMLLLESRCFLIIQLGEEIR